MALAPPGANGKQAAFTLLEVLVTCALVAALAGLLLGAGRHATDAARAARTQAELATLTAALDAYRRACGDFPRTADGGRLLQSLLGRFDPAGESMAGRTCVDLGRLTVRDGRDPLTDAAAELVDAWGEPYHYAYRTLEPWRNASFILYSAGPDGAVATSLLAGGFVDETAPANADNLYPGHR